MRRHLLLWPLAAGIALLASTEPTSVASAVDGAATVADAGIVDRAAFLNPPSDVRPAIRWWWPGGDVDDQELAREIDVMSAAGFGAAEIQSFAVGLPPDGPAAVKTYGTSPWFDHVGAALNEAQRLGFTIDLTAGSSWPTGGDDVTSPQSLQQLISTGALVTGPGTLDVPFPGPTEPVRYNLALQLFKLPDTFDPTLMTPVAIFAVRLDADQTQTGPAVAATLPNLPSLPPTTFLDSGSVVDLGPFVASGRLQWTIPAGAWAVFAFYSGPTGSQPFYGADPNGGLVVDHLNQAALASHLDALAGTAQSRFGSQFGTTLSSLFVDSFELRTELYWTADFLAEFAARRGYRLEPFLPVLFVPFQNDTYVRSFYPDATPQFEMRSAGSRVRHDYAVTVSELMVERFFTTFGAWSAAHGIRSRVQAHGAPVDLLSAYTRASIPETESLYAGGLPGFVKYAASAAHASGAPLVSSEVFANQGGDAVLSRMMQVANAQFAAGVNHLVMHGFPYFYLPGFGTRGWMPFQSQYLPAANLFGTFGTWLNDTSALWRFMPAINAQFARTQLVLREGNPAANVALYTDRIGYPDDSTYNPDVNQQVELSGQNYDYVNGDLLGPAAVSASMLQVGPSAYHALVLDNVSQMQVDVSERVAQLVQSGLPVVFIGDVPHQQPGYSNAGQNDGLVRAIFEQMFGQTREALIAQAKVKAGSAMFIAAASDLPATLAVDLNITPDLILDDYRNDIHFAHRQTGAADYYFFTSSGSQAFDTSVSFGHDASRTPYIFDLNTGSVTAAPVYLVQGTRTIVSIHLEPGGAALVGFEPAGGSPVPHVEATDVPFVSRDASGNLLMAVQSAGTYSVTVDGKTVNVSLGSLSIPPIFVPVWDLVALSWNGQGGVTSQSFPGITLNDLSMVPQLSGFAGSAVYGATVQVDPRYFAPSVRVVLSLGRVYDVAEVKVNGQLVATLTSSPFNVDVSSYLTVGANRLEIAVTTSGSPSGLIGPVSLAPMQQVPLSTLQPVAVPPLPFTIDVTPANLQNATDDEVAAAIAQAAQITNEANFQWIWNTPPTPQNPGGGPVVGCAQIGPWVAAARQQGLGVTLQFQAFVTQLTAPNTPPVIRVANPITPFDQGTFANPDVVSAYLDEITCLAGLGPDYLVLGPEVNFVVTFDFAEFQRYVAVYRRAYDIVKTLSPWTQVGLSWQYDGLRDSLPLDTWGYIPAAGPQDFIGLTSYFGYSDSRVSQYPSATSIPADYYSPIRARFGPSIPILFTEIGYSSQYADGLANQAEFLSRLPALLQGVRPIGVVWPLLNDVQFFGGPINGLNESGLIASDGTLKPAWNTAIQMKADGRLANITPAVFAPSPLPFAVNASPPDFPTVLSDDLNAAALVSASAIGSHVSFRFEWQDHVTHQVWNCPDIQKYTDQARQLGLHFTLQFNTYAAIPPASPDQAVRVVLLNPYVPPDPSSDGPSIGDPRILEPYLEQVACLAGLGADYLVLGPELNVLLAARPDEFFQFVSAYQTAYVLARSVSPSTQVGVSYQYEALRSGLLQGQLPWYISAVGPQDYVGFSSYFDYSDESNREYPSVLSVPYDYYDPIRTVVGQNIPVVFTAIGWPSYYPDGQVNQALLLNRLPTLMQSVTPANVIWALQYDVSGYFPGPIAALNSLGLGNYDGTAKLAWLQALRLRQTGLFTTAASPIPH